MAQELATYTEYLSLTRRLKREPAKLTPARATKIDQMKKRLAEIGPRTEARIKELDVTFNQKWADNDFSLDPKGL